MPGNRPAPTFLDELHLESVREINMACGVEQNGFLVDVHSRPLRASTVELARQIVHRANGSVWSTFELALTRVKRGSPHTYTLLWQHDPAAVLTSLVNETPITADELQGDYRVTLNAGLPGMFSIEPM